MRQPKARGKPQRNTKPPMDPNLKRILELLALYERWFGLLFFALGIPSGKGGPTGGRGQRGTETKNGTLEKPRPRRLRPGGIL